MKLIVERSHDMATPAWNAMPDFLTAHNYQNPADPTDAPLQKAFDSKKHFFELMHERNIMVTFQEFMSSYRQDRADFLDVYPAEERLVKGFEPKNTSDGSEGVLLVDVGGGHGHELEKFVKKFPVASDGGKKLWLQDQEEIIEQVKSSRQASGVDNAEKQVEIMAYDFFTPQSVKHARGYYFRMIFHDCTSFPSFPDPLSRAPSYSFLTILQGRTRSAWKSSATPP